MNLLKNRTTFSTDKLLSYVARAETAELKKKKDIIEKIISLI